MPIGVGDADALRVGAGHCAPGTEVSDLVAGADGVAGVVGDDPGGDLFLANGLPVGMLLVDGGELAGESLGVVAGRRRRDVEIAARQCAAVPLEAPAEADLVGAELLDAVGDRDGCLFDFSGAITAKTSPDSPTATAKITRPCRGLEMNIAAVMEATVAPTVRATP